MVMITGLGKQDISVWRLCTKDEKKKHAAQVYLSLKGAAREAVRGIAHEDLVKDDGFETLIAVLDKIYLKDTATQAYCAFRDFVEYRRSGGETFSVFFIEFEKRYREVEKSDMKLPSGVKAYFLLQAANLTTENERLARTTAKLEFDDMKVQLQKVFGEAQGNGKDAAVPIKTEEVFAASRKRRDQVESREEEEEEEALLTNQGRNFKERR